MRTQNISSVLENLKDFRPTKEYSSTPIWWRFDDTAFPDPGWVDHPAIILPWWVAQLTVLMQGARTAELHVMEGPYALILRPAGGDEVEVSDPEWEEPKTVLSVELVQAVMEALRRVAPSFDTLPELRAYAHGLRELADQLDWHLYDREQTHH